LLTNVGLTDLEWIERSIDDWLATARWSLVGLTPSIQGLNRLLWNEVAVQQTVRSESHEAVGLLQLANVDLHHGIANLELLANPLATGQVTAGIEAFLARVFADVPLRKVGIEAVRDEVDVQLLVGPAVRQVGCRERHVRRGEFAFADVQVFELWREDLPCLAR